MLGPNVKHVQKTVFWDETNVNHSVHSKTKADKLFASNIIFYIYQYRCLNLGEVSRQWQ